MVIGCYYMTTNNIRNLKNANHYFSSFDDVLLAFESQKVELHSSIWVRYKDDLPENLLEQKNWNKKNFKDDSILKYSDEWQIHLDKNNNIISCFIRTTPGRILLNNTIMGILTNENKN